MIASKEWVKSLLEKCFNKREVVLYEGTLPTLLNNNKILSTSDHVTLNESIENFKFISFESTTYDNMNGDGGIVHQYCIYPSSYIKTTYGNSALESDCGYGSYISRHTYGFYDSTSCSLCWANYTGWSHNTSTFKIVGYKY